MEPSERYEYKFVLSPEQRAALLEILSRELLADTHGGSAGWYPIVSLYYDTPDLKCYWENWRDLPSRRKLRVRVYGSSDGAIAPTSFIEIKHKDFSRGTKRRIQTALPHALAIARGETVDANFNHAEQTAVQEVHRLVQEEHFRPTLLIRYQRYAYFLHTPNVAPADRLRVTFDQNIATRAHDLIPQPDDQNFSDYILPKGHCVMELKGRQAVPFNFVHALTKLQLKPRQFSKYSEGIRLEKLHLQPQS